MRSPNVIRSQGKATRSGEENLEFVSNISRSADTILLGRKTYDLLNNYWINVKDLPTASMAEIEFSTWYSSASKLVISNSIKEVKNDKVTILNKDIIKSISKLKQDNGPAIIIFTSPSVTQLLMEYNLIDIYWLFFNPFFFGKGIRLFKNVPANINLKFCETKRFENEELAIKYIRKK